MDLVALIYSLMSRDAFPERFAHPERSTYHSAIGQSNRAVTPQIR